MNKLELINALAHKKGKPQLVRDCITEKESKTEIYNKTTFMTGYLTETDCKGNVKYLETIPMDNNNPLKTLENTEKSKKWE